MLSLLTNTAAMTASRNLAATQAAMDKVKSQLSSGLRVQGPGDDPAAWSAAQSANSDIGALAAVKDALSVGGALMAPATAALAATQGILTKMASDVTALQGGTLSASAAQGDFSALQQSLASVVSGAAIGGVNLLDGSQSGGVTYAGSFTRNASGGVTISTSTITTTGAGGTQLAGMNGLFATQIGTFSDPSVSGVGGTGVGVAAYAPGSLLSLDLAKASPSDLASISSALSGMATQVAGMQATLAGKTTGLGMMQTYAQAMSDALASSVGSLVDADMNAASTRLQALQTQEQVGIQVLAIANGEGALILRLFGIS